MAYKPLHKRPKDDIIRIVGEYFDASELDRLEKNKQNFSHYRAFHCRDILKMSDIAKTIRDGERVMTGGMPTLDLGPIATNKTYLPWLRGIVLTSVARVAHGLWPDFNDFYRLDPEHDGDLDSLKAMYALTEFYIRNSNYKREGLLALLQAHLFDFSVLYTGWQIVKKRVPTSVAPTVEIKDYATGEFFDTGIPDERERETDWEDVAIEGWEVSSVNTMNFRYDPLASHDSWGEFCGVTMLMPKRRVQQLIDDEQWDGDALEEIKEDEPPNQADRPDTTNDANAMLREDEKLSGGSDALGFVEKHYVRVDLCWTEDSRVALVNRRAVAEASESWRIPFHKQVFIANFGMLPGTSLAEPLMPAQHDINLCLRLMRTQQDKAVNPDSVTDPTFFRNALEAEIQPWETGANIILSRNPEGRDPSLVRRYIEHPGARNAVDMWNSITIQTQFGEAASGVARPDQGVVQGGASATEIARAAMAVDIRGAFVEVYIEDTMVVMPIYDLMDLIQMNVTQPMRLEIAGEDGLKWRDVDPKQIAFNRRPRVKALGMSSMASRQVGAQAVRDVTYAFLQNPMTAQFMKIQGSMQDVYRQYDIDPDRYVKEEDYSLKESIPAKFVPVLIAEGYDVQVQPWDDHESVILAIITFRQSPAWQKTTPQNKQRMTQHIQIRQAAIQNQQMGGGKGLTSPASPFGGGGGGAGGVQQPPGAGGVPGARQQPVQGGGNGQGSPGGLLEPVAGGGAEAGGTQ